MEFAKAMLIMLFGVPCFHVEFIETFKQIYDHSLIEYVKGEFWVLFEFHKCPWGF